MTINQTENLAAKSKKLRAPQPGALFYSIPDFGGAPRYV